MQILIKNLQKQILILLACIVICGMFLISAYSWRQSSYEYTDIQGSKLKLARSKYYTALNQKILLEKFEKKYNDLIKAGIVGEEKRLNWVDSLEKITKKNKIPYIKYKINKRKIIKSASLSQLFPGIVLYKSMMSLDMQLLHEGDLYSILDEFSNQAKGLFDVQRCSIKRNSTKIKFVAESTTDKNFSANCILNWYTMTMQTPGEVSAEGI